MSMVSRSAVIIGACTLVLVGAGLTAQRTPSDTREQAWRANNVGVAYLEQFDYGKASAEFRRALDIDASLTAARVNLAIAELYLPDLASARREAEAVAARPDAPPHAPFVLGLVARAENREDDAIAAFRRVLEIDPDDVGALVNLGQLLLQQRAYDEAVAVFRRAVGLEPYNVSALYNLAVSLTRAGDRAAGAEVTARFQALRESGYGTTYSNTYMEQGRYAEAVLSTGAEAEFVDRERPAVTYEPTPLPAVAAPTGDAPVVGLAAGDLDGDGRTDVLRVSADRVAPGIGDGAAIDVRGLGARSAAVADMDNDGTPDVVVHGRAGMRVLRQGTGSPRFTDVTQQTGITSRLDVHTVALVDLDHDGDLDIVAGGDTRDGAPALLEAWRNNGDGTFTDISAATFTDQAPARVRRIAATDFDLRRDIDLIVQAIDGAPRLWRNMRDGTFRDASAATGLDALPAASTFAIGDVNKDGYPDLVVSAVRGPGAIALGSANNRVQIQPFEAMPAAATTALVLDVDNDGLLDVVATTAEGLHVLRHAGDAWQTLTDTAVPSDARATAAQGSLVALDANGDGALDLVTLAAGRATVWSARGVAHPAVRVRLTGQVSNRSGVGSKVEMRAGSLWQKTETAAASPAVVPADILFGLGRRQEVDVIRVLWPAGIVQAEVQLAGSGQGTSRAGARSVEVVELDRKPSSCPYLFTWNGERFEFVSDFLGGGEMGYQLAPGVYNTPDPEEYVRIRGDQLRVRDGRLELRVTNELEETLFLDMFSLVAVDHPDDVEVHPREGLFAPPFPAFTLYAARDSRPIVSASDDEGRDVLDALHEVDRRYVDRLPTLPIRGYARPHALTLDLGDVPVRGTLLLLTGWTDYAFSSDNVAAAQAGYALQPPSLQVEDADGRWQTVIPEVGVPVGRPQTVVVDLTDAFPSGSRRVRIVTSMRVYWDAARVAVRDERVSPVVTRLAASEATLRWRGFSAIASREEPLTFDYHRVTPHAPWKQMPGRYTREGDVRTLVRDVDDMFVVSRPGDEVALAFDAATLPELPSGWTRTYLLHSDGFSKEMDINSASPDHAWPLPRHGMSGYPVTSSDADEPDWVARYNTRVVGRQVSRLAGVTP